MADFFEASALDDGSKEQLCRDLLSEFGVNRVKATPKGELIHSCPLPFGGHRNGDKNPSASLNYRKLTFKCLGCGNSGGLLWFIASCRGETSEEARTWLNDQTGMGQSVMELGNLLKVLDQLYAGPVDERPPIPRYDRSVLRPWTWNLQHPWMTDPPPDGRGIPSSTLDKFGVGYAEEYFDGTERIIIPLWWKGELVGWQARHVGDGDHPDKYRNSPDFPRDRVIFNYENGDRHSAIVVESPASVLRHHHHRSEMQATFGANVTDDQIRLLQRYQRVLLWFDNDPAGWKATERVGGQLAPYNTVWVVNYPGREDPADLDDGPVDFFVEEAIPFALWKSPAQAGTSKESRRGYSQVRHG